MSAVNLTELEFRLHTYRMAVETLAIALYSQDRQQGINAEPPLDWMDIGEEDRQLYRDAAARIAKGPVAAGYDDDE